MKKALQFLLLLSFLTGTAIFAQKTGKASFYSSRLQGRHTSDGGKYHADSLTCAHLSYPFGTMLQVRNPRNNKTVIVKVTDRGPHTRNRLIDLSYTAARQLDIIREGIAWVEITKLEYFPLLPTMLALPIPRVLLTVQRTYSVTGIMKNGN